MTPADGNAPSAGDEQVDARGGAHALEAKSGDLGFALPAPARVSRARVVLGVGVSFAALAVAFGAAYWPRYRERQALETSTKAAISTTLKVEAIVPKQAASNRALALPGSMQAIQETAVYARASGYVRQFHVDIGDKVKEGDLLVEIDTPEIDQQLAQARAQLAQAEANLVQTKASAAFSKQNFERYQKLAPAGVTSQEETEKARSQADVDAANVLVANANVEAQKANIQRLAQVKSFDRVLAPFSGTITVRSVSKGGLVTAGTGSPLYRIAAMDPMRVFVQVPQDVAPNANVGAIAAVTVREFPGRTFEGKLTRSASALDASTRTMTIIVNVPNPKGELLAGMYAQVALTLPTPHRVYEVPATALINDAKGLRVATVDNDSRVQILPVVVERDTGSTIEIASGLTGSERIVKLPGVELSDGTLVEVAK